MMSQEACRHLLHLKKQLGDLFSPCIFQLLILCAQNVSRRLVLIVSCNPRKTNIKVFFLGLQRMMTNIALVVIFSRNFIRTTEDENECNTHNHLLCKGKKMKKKQRKKSWCTFTYHRCISYFLEEHFLQHHFNNVFCSTASTLLLQHHLLQHRFNTAFATSSSAAPLQHCFCNIVFYSIASTPPLQHCLLQQHFNITFVAPSSATLFLLLSGAEV